MTKKALATLIMVIILAILSGCRTLVASGSEARTDCGGQAGYESNNPLYEETIAESSRCEAYETAAQETIGKRLWNKGLWSKRLRHRRPRTRKCFPSLISTMALLWD